MNSTQHNTCVRLRKIMEKITIERLTKCSFLRLIENPYIGFLNYDTEYYCNCDDVNAFVEKNNKENKDVELYVRDENYYGCDLTKVNYVGVGYVKDPNAKNGEKIVYTFV